jgi:4-hydroxy-3-polyprenylbenzoate decarboxylase
MAYFRDLHEWLDFLDSRGFLRRISRPINKDTEMHPLVRFQFRGLQEPDRKGWLFDNVVDVTGRKYEIPVALAVMAPNRLVYALGMGVNSAAEISAKWAYAQTHAIPPRTLSSGPCQELIFEGQALRDAGGAGMLPVPISTPGFDSAPFLSSGHWVTKDPETGDLNFGTYRGSDQKPNTHRPVRLCVPGCQRPLEQGPRPGQTAGSGDRDRLHAESLLLLHLPRAAGV